MNSLFIGRFQPFHLGHLSVIKEICNSQKNNELLYIGIGSAQDNYLPDNPFTAAERFIMIDTTLQKEGIKPSQYRIIPVPNIQNYALWPRQVEIFIPPFQKLYTGSTIVQKLFEDYNQQLKHPYQIIFIQPTFDISASKIRSLIKNDQEWESLVPPTTLKFLKNIDTIERIKKL